MLRRARESAGIDVTTMSRRLHIRPDILKAIENADFDKMPARGYSRNMIRAYARQVGLDERSISERYLDEVHLHEVGMPRQSRRYQSRSYSDNERSSGTSQYRDEGMYGQRRPRAYSNRSQDYSSRQTFDAARDRRPGVSAYGAQNYYGERPEELDGRSRSINFRSSPRDRYDLRDEPVRYGGRRSQPLPDDILPSRSVNLNNYSSGAQRARRDRNRTQLPPQDRHSYTSMYSSGTSSSRGVRLNMPMIIILGIVAIAVIIAVVVLFNSGKQSVDEIPDIPISGLTDTSEPENTVPSAQTSAAPVSAQVKYEVEGGARSWIEVVENGETVFSGVVSGPASETYDVTGTLKFSTANPEPVSLTVDGEKVKLSKSSSSDYYTYTVDFSEILNAWRAENEPASTSDASNMSNTSAATNATSSSDTAGGAAVSNSTSSSKSSTNSTASNNSSSSR